MLYFVTDWHFRERNPERRLGNYLGDMTDKLQQFCLKLTEADVVLCGGDLFDAPNVGDRVLALVVEILAECPARWGFVAGQHDVIGHNLGTVNRCSLGVVLALPNCRLLTAASWSLPEYQVSGRNWGCWGDEPMWFEDSRKRILVAHAPITASPQVFTSLVADTLDADADLVLCGDIHQGLPFGTHTRNGILLVNPGSTARKSIIDANRVPKALSLWYDDKASWQFQEHPLSQRIGQEVFDLQTAAIDKQAERQRDAWVTSVQAVSERTGLPEDPAQLVEKVGMELGKSQAVIDHMKERVQ